MAQRKVAIKICDRDGFGKDRPATQTRKFSIDGQFYEIDLCDQHAAMFDRDIGGWALVARDDDYVPRINVPKANGVFTPQQTEAARKAAALRVEQQKLDADVEALVPRAEEPAQLAPVHQLSYAAEQWVLTPHAQQRAAQRGYTLNEVLAAAADPEQTYGNAPGKYGEGARLHMRGECTVAVNPERKVVISVLHRDQSRYALTDPPRQEARIAQ